MKIFLSEIKEDKESYKNCSSHDQNYSQRLAKFSIVYVRTYVNADWQLKTKVCKHTCTLHGIPNNTSKNLEHQRSALFCANAI